MQAQIQPLLAREVEERVIEGSNTESNIEVAKPPVFNREVSKVRGFIIVCKLYLRMRMRGTIVEEQIQWVLSYVQKGSADI